MPVEIRTVENGKRVIIRGRTKFIERTKDFYIQEGYENQPNFVRAIKIRKAMGDKL